MTTEQAKELLVEGRTIQHLLIPGGWQTTRLIDLNDDRKCYRLRPEPREFWITDNPDCTGRMLASPTRRDAEFACAPGVEIIHVREVL